jgi:hypothetical protein
MAAVKRHGLTCRHNKKKSLLISTILHSVNNDVAMVTPEETPNIMNYFISMYTCAFVCVCVCVCVCVLTHVYTRGAQKVMQHIHFLGPVLFDKNNILCAAAFKCPTFMHIVARFPAR